MVDIITGIFLSPRWLTSELRIETLSDLSSISSVYKTVAQNSQHSMYYSIFSQKELEQFVYYSIYEAKMENHMMW